jgi:hypothetical protein
MQKTICDECGTEQGVGRVTINVARSTPITLPSNMQSSLDQDLCQPCANRLFAALESVLEKG